MKNWETTEWFASLFFGRLDAYGTEEGGCAHVPKQEATYEHYLERVGEHLWGYTPMGVYPIHESRTHVSWGCVDFDEGEEESYVHAMNLSNLLAMFNVKGWVERSRSKGYHVWVFLEDTLRANIVRHALLAACQVVGAPTKEINPKQTALEPGQVGNYVRLPYPHETRHSHATDHPGARRVMIENGHPISLTDFVQKAIANLTATDKVQELARLYRKPEPPKAKVVTPHVALTSTPSAVWPETDIHRRMTGLAWTIYNNGPLDGSDRSGTLWKLIRTLIENQTHDMAETIQLAEEANARWGKPYKDGVIAGMVMKAWGA